MRNGGQFNLAATDCISIAASVSNAEFGTTAATDHGQLSTIFVMKEWMLSPRETCLRWIAVGRTVAEFASLEGKSVAYMGLRGHSCNNTR